MRFLTLLMLVLLAACAQREAHSLGGNLTIEAAK